MKVDEILEIHLLRTDDAIEKSAINIKGCCIMCGYPIDRETMKKNIMPLKSALYDLVKECLVEERDPVDYNRDIVNSAHPHNNCRQVIKDKIDELFEVKP